MILFDEEVRAELIECGYNPDDDEDVLAWAEDLLEG